MMKKPLLAANWKMHLTLKEALELAQAIASVAQKYSERNVIIFAPYVYLYPLHEVLKNSQVQLGAQNLFYENQGAYTGEVAGFMLREVGCSWVLVAHSERRQYFHESNQTANLKIKRALQDGLMVMYCVGETLEQREENLTEKVVLSQLEEGLRGLSSSDFQSLAIAYEPVWAIGTGKNATPQDAQKVHEAIRHRLAELSQGQKDTPILYGGSVKPENIKELMAMPDVDGVLVGGASLKIDTFGPIVGF
ncbi:MAG: triose-phosphate isomerase [Leptospiraceae bacterium]|nr:triose-phosphate isomerase [Leptospiraceae bacterium]MDW8307049.1 triose-phosphate isomerase [Leptospiraceae bacterium]